MPPLEFRLNTFVKYFISFTGLTLVLVFSIAVLLGANASKRIDAETVAANDLRLENISALAETAILLPAYRALIDIVTSEEIRGADYGDAYCCLELHRALKTKAKIHPSVESLSLYVPTHDLLISSQAIRYDMTNHLDQEFTNLLRGEALVPTNRWFGPRYVPASNTAAENVPLGHFVVSCVLASTRQSAEGTPRFYVFANVRRDALGAVISSLSTDPNETIIAYSSNGGTVAAHNLEPIRDESFPDALEMGAAEGIRQALEESADTSRMVVSVYDSPDTGWHYALFAEPAAYFRVSRDFRTRVVLLSVIVLAVGVALSLLLSRGLYRPLARLSQNIDNPMSSGKAKNEYLLIAKTIEGLHASLDRLERETSRSVLDQLLKGSTLGLNGRRAAELLPFGSAVVLYYATSREDTMHASLSRVGSFADSLHHGFLLPIDRSSCAVIENTDEDQPALRARLSSRIRDFVGTLTPSASVGVGSVIDQFDLLPQCYSQARAAQRYVFLHPGQRLFFYDDVCHRRNLRSATDMEAVEEAVAARDVERVKRFFEELEREIASAEYSYDSVEDTVFAIIPHIDIRRLRLAGDPSVVSYRRIYSDFHERASVYDGLTWLQNLMTDAFETDDSVDSAQLVIGGIKEYIDAHYSNRVSLKYLADEFYMSSGYISYMFKKTYGIGIAEYLSNLRLEKAKSLLENEKTNVEKVAAVVGMTNTSYFIKRFKSKYGMTPNRFRLKSRRDRFLTTPHTEPQ